MSEPDKPVAFMEPRTLRQLAADGDNVLIVDVRSAEEFAAGHVDGAINTPADQLDSRTNELSKDATIVTVCNLGGSRSCNAAERLRTQGYLKALPLRGGTRGWFDGSCL